MGFEITTQPIEPGMLRERMQDDAAGALVCFEGWVRNHAAGRAVDGLEYEVYAALALREGERILEEAHARFDILHSCCVHRVGVLEISDGAVWVGVSAAHRDAAFDACRYIIDELKLRVPVWKKERFGEGTAHWVNSAGCAATG